MSSSYDNSEPSLEQWYWRPRAWPSVSINFIAVCRGRIADNKSTGILTSPNVIVPDHSDRTGALPASCTDSAASSFDFALFFRLGNFPLPRRGDARLQTADEVFLR